VARAAVLIPTHDAAATLDLAVGSALAQTLTDLEVVIIGDGVSAEVRELAGQLVDSDSRVRFLDLPKGDHHGEIHRDTAIRGCNAPVVCYLCDDDLLLPGHVASMVELLEQADLANAMNGHLSTDGAFQPYMSDLASVDHRRWMLHPHRNSVSVTGTAHTVSSYLRIPVGWQAPPPGRWTDHVMWQKFLALPDLRAVTSSRVTALQFPTHLEGRERWTPAERRAELERWWSVICDPAGRAALDDVVRTGLNQHGALLQQAADDRADLLDAARDEIVALQGHIDGIERANADLTERLARIEGSRTWRLRRALVRGPLARLVRK
jgi:hypothetical protein